MRISFEVVTVSYVIWRFSIFYHDVLIISFFVAYDASMRDHSSYIYIFLSIGNVNNPRNQKNAFWKSSISLNVLWTPNKIHANTNNTGKNVNI